VTEIIHAPLLEEGRLERGPSGSRIWVSDALPPLRARFTIAHEVAHLLFDSELGATPEAVATVAAFRSEEARTDAVAGGLLMPRTWVLARFGAAPHSLAAVKELARSCEVSLAAALVRLREVCGWRESLLHWAWERDRWILDGQAGLFSSQMGVVRSSEDTHWHLCAYIGQETPQHVSLPLLVAGRPEEVSVELSVRPGSAVALVAAGQVPERVLQRAA
jgi:hypothetical protein